MSHDKVDGDDLQVSDYDARDHQPVEDNAVKETVGHGIVGISAIDHKQKKTGNKPVLVHRILRSLRFDNSSQSDSDSSEYSSGEESEPIPPLSSLQDGWASISTSVCPPIRQEDVDNYFIFNKNPFTGKHKNCHRQLKKAKKFSNENYIHDIKIHDINSKK